MADNIYQWNDLTTESSLNKVKLDKAPTITKNSKTFVDNVNVTITHDKVCALIVGKYQMTIQGTYIGDDDSYHNKSFTYTCNITTNPKLCTKENINIFKISLQLEPLEKGEISSDSEEFFNEDNNTKWTITEFKILEGDNRNLTPNTYLYELDAPLLVEELTINGHKIDDKTYVQGSALPIDKINNISNIDFNNISVGGQNGIFTALEAAMVHITTKELKVPELTNVSLPELKNDEIIICKSRSMNNGITFNAKDPDTDRNHFGYTIKIKNKKSMGYKSIWVDRETMNEMFPNMPEDIMSTTKVFEYKDRFTLNKLTYNYEDIAAPTYVNQKDQEFNDDDIDRLKNDLAPTYSKVTITEAPDDVSTRDNNILLKNIEFVKFGDKVIKLNYEPLSEAQNQSI